MYNKLNELFAVGDRVVVVKNSERIHGYAKVGKHGMVIGHVCNDCIVKFDDGSTHCIWYIDLEKELEQDE